MEEAIDEELLVEHFDELRRDVVGIQAERLERVSLRDLHAIHERHRHHGARRVLRVDLREQDVRIVGEVLGHPLDHRGLVDEVGLALEHVAELLVDTLDLLDRDEVLVDLDRPAEHLQIDLDDGRDAGIEHLDGELGARCILGFVNLAERRGGDRLVRERLEHLLRRLAERFDERLADRLVRLGRHVVLQRLELLDDLARQERPHDGEDLTQLDVHAAQRDEAAIHATRVLAMRLLPLLGGIAARRPQLCPRERPDVAQEDDREDSRRTD